MLVFFSMFPPPCCFRPSTQDACWNLRVFEASFCIPDCSKPALTCCNRDSSRVDFWVGKKKTYRCNPPWIYGEGFQGITVSVSKIQTTVLIMFIHHTAWFLIGESGFKTGSFPTNIRLDAALKTVPKPDTRWQYPLSDKQRLRNNAKRQCKMVPAIPTLTCGNLSDTPASEMESNYF